MKELLDDDEFNELAGQGVIGNEPAADDPRLVYVVCPYCGARFGVPPAALAEPIHCQSCDLDFVAENPRRPA